MLLYQMLMSALLQWSVVFLTKKISTLLNASCIQYTLLLGWTILYEHLKNFIADRVVQNNSCATVK